MAARTFIRMSGIMMRLSALVAVMVLAGCASAERIPTIRPLPEASLVAANMPPARDCLPPPTPLEPPGPDPLAQALKHYVRGRLMMTEQQTVQAAEALRQAAHLAPDVACVWVNLGLSQYDAGRIADSIDALDRALKLVPTDPPALYYRGRIAAARGDPPGAAAFFARLVDATDPDTPYHMLGTYHLARAHENQGNLRQAIEAYESLLDALANPQPFFRRYPGLYLIFRSQLKLKSRLATLLVNQGQADRAIEVLQEAIGQRPRNPELLDLMVQAHLARKDYAAARQCIYRLIDIQPDSEDGYQRLVQAYRSEGRSADALPELEHYHQQYPDNQALALLLASMYEAAGRHDKAGDLYRGLVRPGATSGAAPSAALKLADIHLEDGRPVDALDALAATMVDAVVHSAVLVKAAKIIDGLPDRLRTYDEARRLVGEDVSHYGPFVLVGMLAEATGRPEEALSLYDKALSRQPKAAIAYSRKADLLIRAKRYADALMVYQSAVRSGLNLPIFHRKMGMLLEELGRQDEAIRAYRMAAKGAPLDKPTAYLLAAALGRKNRFDEAAKVLQDLLVQHPKDLNAHVHLAGIYLAQDNMTAAEDVAMRGRALYPEATSPMAVLAEIRFRQERYDETLDLIRQVLKAEPDRGAVRVLMAYTLAAKGDVAAAAKEVEALLAAEPEHIPWRYLLSGLYTEMGEAEAAERELLRILDTNADHAPSNNDLGYLWADRGANLGRAETLVRRALRASPKQPSYLDSLGWVMYKQGRFQDAVVTLEEATHLAPKLDPVLWDHLGDSYWRLERRKEAESAWKTAAQMFETRDKKTEAEHLGRVRAKLKQAEKGGRPPVAPVADGAPSTPNGAARTSPTPNP